MRSIKTPHLLYLLTYLVGLSVCLSARNACIAAKPYVVYRESATVLLDRAITSFYALSIVG